MPALLLSIVIVLALLVRPSDSPLTSDRPQTAPPHHTIVPLPNFWDGAPKTLERGFEVWIVDLLPHEAAGPVGQMMEQGMRVMKTTLDALATAGAATRS